VRGGSTADAAATPLDIRAFFTGVWRAEGALRPAGWLRWLLPTEQVRAVSRPRWFSEQAWRVEESFEFSGSPAIAREMAVEIVAPDRLRVTAPDMPGGAEILLSKDGFRFTPYVIEIRRFGRKWRLRCRDESRIRPDGLIENVIRMSLFGLPAMVMDVVVERRTA
jgi:hypothetical protein